MFAYISRRIGALIVILFGSSFILYNLAAISGDPLEALRTSSEPNAKQQIITLTRTLQLDIPPPLRYFYWLRGILGGFTGHIDFGRARDGHPVSELIANAIPVTIRLVTAATIAAILLGITIGIITALRQYSRFDYAMTFVSFLLFSLPVFWVAVLLKQYLAIRFNTFLSTSTVPPLSIAFFSIVSGVFWSAVISGSRRRVLIIFGVAAGSSALLLEILSLLKWFMHPGLGIFVLGLLGIGVACGVTQLSTGLDNKTAVKASLTVVALGVIGYYPANYAMRHFAHTSTILLLGLFTIVISVVTGYIFAKIDRAAIIRTTTITGFIFGLLTLLDKLMQTWAPYMATDAINNRPIPTIGQNNSQVDPTNYWFMTLDTLLHLILPTLALLLISFAGYVRFTRGTLLEVLNSDYIRTARSKGLNERTVIMRHAFRNTLIPLSTIIVADFLGILGGAIITESVFGWVGMGTLFRQGLLGFDLNLLMSVFFITASLAVIANLIADLLYSLLDPRIRVGAGK
jgi:peptide/nickel transport system permease protein